MKRRHLILLTLTSAGLVTAVTLLLRIFVNFARPQLLWLGALVVVTAGLWGGYQLWRQRLAAELGEHAAVERMAADWSPRAAVGRIALLLLAMQCFVLGAAQPQWGEATRRVQREGIDIVLAVDASRSMLAEDVPPSRLDAAAREVNTLLNRLSGDRVGLVVFAGFAFTQSPLTSDYGAIRLYVDRLNPDAIPAQGTALGRAIREGTELLTGGGDETFRRSDNQLIIVISDGEDHETEPVEAARAAAESGVRVYTVGIGTESGGRIPMRDREGNLGGWFVDRNGEVVVTRLADAQLQEVASAGNGQYVRYSGPNSIARFVERAIDDFEEEELTSALRTQYVDRPGFFLLPGLLALLAYLVLVERTRRSLRAALLVTLFVSACQPIEHRDPNVRRAAELSDEGNHDEALSEIEGTGAAARENPAFYYNRGLIFERLDNAEAAAESYLEALGASEAETRLRALVGLGNSLFYQEDFESALERYERVLRDDPERENARRNLEITLRRLFPPCRELDDELEENDSAEEASDLPAAAWVGANAEFNRQEYGGQEPPPQGAPPEAPEAIDLVGCGLDSDWYALPLEAGGELTLRADLQRLRDDTGGPPPPAEIAPSAISLAVVNARGEVYAVDQGIDSETPRVDAQRVQREIAALPITEEMSNEALFVLVEISAGLEYRYDLEVDFTPPCSALDDQFEDNDTPMTAWPLEEGEHDARVCVDDEDWYSVTLSDGADLFVDVWTTPLDEESFLPLEVSPASSATEDRRFEALAPGQPLETFSVRDVYEAETFRYAVRAASEQEGPYQIDAWIYPPCPVGNDRFEPNDQPPEEVTMLEARQNQLRHLRLCEADEDWFVMQLPPPDEDAEEEERPESEPFAALVEYETPDRTVLVELYDTETGEKIADAVPLEESDYDTEYAGAVVAIANVPAGTPAVGVRVYGDPGYFHLRFPETEAPPQEEQEQQSGDEGEEDQEDEQDESQEDEQDDEQEDENDSEEEQPSEGDEEGDEDDEEQRPEDLTDEEEQARRLFELLNSLEDDELNLQLQQAIDDLPSSRMTNEW